MPIREPNHALDSPPLGAPNAVSARDPHPKAATAVPSPHLGWHRRGYLPHADFPGKLQSITYRLWDSLPQDVVLRLSDELRDADPALVDQRRRERIEDFLDAGYGCCALADSRAAELVVENWRHFDGTRYDLIAWVVMPNHIHVLIRTFCSFPLDDLIQNWKRYTSTRIRRWIREGLVTLPGPGPRTTHSSSFWMRDYWDRFIRDEDHFYNVVRYIHRNPVKAGLVACPDEWPFSSPGSGRSDARR